MDSTKILKSKIVKFKDSLPRNWRQLKICTYHVLAEHDIVYDSVVCVFYIRPSDFSRIFKARRPCHGCTDHDIPRVGLWSKLLMRLSYAHQAYGYNKNEFSCGGSNPGPSGHESSAITSRSGSYVIKKRNISDIHEYTYTYIHCWKKLFTDFFSKYLTF